MSRRSKRRRRLGKRCGNCSHSQPIDDTLKKYICRYPGGGLERTFLYRYQMPPDWCPRVLDISLTEVKLSSVCEEFITEIERQRRPTPVPAHLLGIVEKNDG